MFYDHELDHLRNRADTNIYTSGWAATGAMASTMMNAYEVADTIISDWVANKHVGSKRPVVACTVFLSLVLLGLRSSDILYVFLFCNIAIEGRLYINLRTRAMMSIEILSINHCVSVSPGKGSDSSSVDIKKSLLISVLHYTP
jgi:hypothetical protein